MPQEITPEMAQEPVMTPEVEPSAKMPFEGLDVKTTVPFADLEILVYGEEENKAKIDAMIKDIYNQINTCKDGRCARIMYYLDKGEKTSEEKRQWMLENMKCRFYVFADNVNFKVEPDFIKKSISAIVRYHKAWLHLKDKGIVKVPFKKPQPVASSIPEDISFEDMQSIAESNAD